MCVCVCVYIYIYITVCLLIHTLRGTECFFLLTVVNNAALNMSMQISPWATDFNSFVYIRRSGIAISYSNSVFRVLKNCYSVFCSDCNNLYSLQECICIPVSPIPHQYIIFCLFFFFSFFNIIAVLMGVRDMFLVFLIELHFFCL